MIIIHGCPRSIRPSALNPFCLQSSYGIIGKQTYQFEPLTLGLTATADNLFLGTTRLRVHNPRSYMSTRPKVHLVPKPTPPSPHFPISPSSTSPHVPESTSAVVYKSPSPQVPESISPRVHKSPSLQVPESTSPRVHESKRL